MYIVHLSKDIFAWELFSQGEDSSPWEYKYQPKQHPVPMEDPWEHESTWSS